MNKTINVSLGKQFFHIDEEAYVLLKNYLDAIKQYLLNEEDRDEILADVEARIAELFTEKLQSEREVVQVKEVERVIQIMGKPSDYKVDEEEFDHDETSSTTGSFQSTTKTKQFYRDEEKNLLGGVCAGLAHNFGIDILWMRLIWVVLFFLSYGTFSLLYVVLWIVVPSAKTTAQKLAMMGEPINISNIEKKVKENAEKAATYAKNFDYEKAAKNGKSSVTHFFESFGDVLSRIANVFLKIIGFILVLATGIALVSMIISLLSFGSISIFGIADVDLGNDGPFIFDAPLWLQMLTFFTLAAIPVYFLFLGGLKLINFNLKLFKLRSVLTLLVLWFVAIAYISFLGIRKGISSNSTGEVVELKQLPLKQTDTLSIKMMPNFNYSESVFRSSSNLIKYNPATNEDILVGTSIYIAIQPTTDSVPQIRLSKQSTATTNKEARAVADQINYHYDFKENQLLLDAFFTSDVTLKDDELKISIVLYLPEGTYFKGDEHASTFKDYRQMNFLKWNNNPKDVYQIQNAKIECITCNLNKPKTNEND